MVPISKELSTKIRITVFLATVLVVLRHSINVHIYYPDVYSTGFRDINSFIQILINSLTNIAVPFFFLVSGYLFFYQLKLKLVLSKWKKRVKTLLVPYIIWNILMLVFLLTIQRISFIDKYSSFEYININLKTVLNNILIDPALGQFWYIRDLLLFVIISPALLLIFKNKYIFYIYLVLLLYIWQPIDTSFFSTEGIFFYSIGGFLGYTNKNMRVNFSGALVIATFVFWIALKLILMFNLFSNIEFVMSLEKLAILVGILFFWCSSDRINKKVEKHLLALSAYAFFIYAFQAPTINIIYKGTLTLLPQSQLLGLFTYFFAVIVVVALSILLAKILKSYTPKFYFLLTGNR